MKNKIALFGIVLAMLISGCSLKDAEQDAGVSITGNTGKISGTVILNEVQKLSRKNLASLDQWDSIEVILGHEGDTNWVLESTSVDSNGYFEFDQLEESIYYLEACLPNGEKIRKANVVLKEGESLKVELRQGASLGASGFEVWDLEVISIPDVSAESLQNGCALQGSSSPFPFVDVRLRKVSRWNPEPTLGKRLVVGAVVDFSNYFYSANISILRPIGMNSQILMVGLCVDSLPERRLEITRKGTEFSCTLLDPVDSIQVSCKAGAPSAPEAKSEKEVLERLGSFPRDFAKYFEDSLGHGIIINPQIGLGNNEAVAQMIDVKEVLMKEEEINSETQDTSDTIHPLVTITYTFPTSSPSRSFVQNISLEELNALLADTLWENWNVGSTLNSSSYWGEVQATFADIERDPYEDLWIPFENVLAPKYNGEDPADAWVSRFHSGYEAHHDINNIRMAGDYAVVSTQGTCWAFPAHYVFKKDSSGVYQHLGHWPIVSETECAQMNAIK